MLVTVQLLKPCHLGPAGAEKQINVQGARQLIADGFAVETDASIAEREKRAANNQKDQNKAFRERDKKAVETKKVSRKKISNKSLNAAE